MARSEPVGLLTEGDFSYEVEDAPLSVGVEMNLDEVVSGIDTGKAPLNKDVMAKWNELLAHLDLKQELRRLIFGGFDSLGDYEKYGDLYVALDIRPRGTATR